MRILIADDHALVREAIALVLQNAGGIDMVQACEMDDVEEAIEHDGPFDLVLLDFEMPGVGGLAGLKKILSRKDRPPIALLSGVASRTVVIESLGFGAIGFVPKTLSADSMIHAVRLMASGEHYLPIDLITGGAQAGFQERDRNAQLTRREIQVLNGLCNGLSNKEIAQIYEVQEVTVKLHVKTLCRKLGAKNRTHAAMIAKETNLL